MTITPMPNGKYTVTDPVTGFSATMTREDAYSKLAREYPNRTAEQERMGLMPLGAYIANYCKFIDGEPYVYDAGYKPLADVLSSGGVQVLAHVQKMLNHQIRVDEANAAELEKVASKLKQIVA